MEQEQLNIAEFRKQFEMAIHGRSQSAFDGRDLNRIRNNDKYVLCFIDWKKGCVDEAVSLASEVLRWRKDMKINDISIDSLDRQLLRRGIVFVHGRAIDNTRLVYFIVRLQTKNVKATVQRILCLWLEKIQQQEPGKHVTFILDVSKASMSNVDLGSIKFLLDCFATYFPDMLERIVVLEMPWIMNAIWKIVKQWMSEEQRRKTVFCSFKDLKQYVDPNNLLINMGGMDDWTYTFPPPENDFPSLNDVCFMSETCDQPQDDDSETYTSVIDCDDSDHDLQATESNVVVEDVAHEGSELRLRVSQSRHEDDPYAEVHTSKNVKTPRPSVTDLQKHPEEPRKFNFVSPDMGFLQLRQRTDSMQHNEPNYVNGVNLSSLLILSPASEIVFRKGNFNAMSGKYESRFTLTNLNRENQVAFKIKSNSPSHYLVKPNTGFVSPGDTVTIYVFLDGGLESVVSKDKFLILYQRKGDATSIKEFWKTHMPQHMRFDYKLTVRFSDKPSSRKSKTDLHKQTFEQRRICSPKYTPPPRVERYVVEKVNLPYQNSSNLSTLDHDDSTVTSITASNSQLDSEVDRLTHELVKLKESLSSVDTASKQMRRKLRFSLVLHCFVLFVLFYVALKLCVLTSLLELGQTWQ